MNALKIDVRMIEEILKRGNTVEIKKTKDKIIIMEVEKKIKASS